MQNLEVGQQNDVPTETAKSLMEKDEKKQKNEVSPGVKENHDSAKEDYFHVRAKRGQATNSHSLAERVCYCSNVHVSILSFLFQFSCRFDFHLLIGEKGKDQRTNEASPRPCSWMQQGNSIFRLFGRLFTSLVMLCSLSLTWLLLLS